MYTGLMEFYTEFINGVIHELACTRGLTSPDLKNISLNNEYSGSRKDFASAFSIDRALEQYQQRQEQHPEQQQEENKNENAQESKQEKEKEKEEEEK